MAKKISCMVRRAAAMGLAGLTMIFTIGTTVSFASEDEKKSGKVMEVAFVEIEGISEVDQYGMRKGLLVDYLNEIAKYTDWEYKYIDTDSESMVTDFINGKYDLMGGAYYSPDLEEYFEYPDYNMGSSRAKLLCRRDDSRIKSYDLRTIDGMTIGVYDQAQDKIDRLYEFLKTNQLDCNIKYFSQEDMEQKKKMKQFFSDQDVDIVMGNDWDEYEELRTVATFSAQPFYIVAHKGDTETVEEINRAMDNILDADLNFAESCYEKNFPDIRQADVQLNDEELSYIASKETVTVAVVENWHPLFCLTDDEEPHDGFLPELFGKLTEYSGLKFNFLPADTYEEALQMVESGNADILGAFLGTEEEAFADDLALSKPYISLNNIIVKNKSVDFPAPGLTGAVVNGRNLPPDIEAEKVYCFNSTKECLEAVNSGKVDFFYGLSSPMDREMQNHRYINVVPVTLINNYTNVCLGLPRPIETRLLTILNKSIGNLKTEDKETILARNMISMGYSTLSVSEMIYANPVAFIAIFGAFLLVVVCGILLVIRARIKNSFIQMELEEAEAKNMAKTEFLSRMSHEIRTPMNAIMGLTDLACMTEDISDNVREKLQKIHSSSTYLLALINDILDMSKIENGKMEIEAEDFSIKKMLKEIQKMMGTQAERKQIALRVHDGAIHDWLRGDEIRLRQVLTNLLSNSVKFTAENGRIDLYVEEKSSDNDAGEYVFRVCDNGTGIAPENLEKIFNSFEQVGTNASRSEGTGLGLPISRSIVRAMGGDLNVKSVPGEGSEFFFRIRIPFGTHQESPEIRHQGKAELQGKRFLLAEDNELNAEIAMELLSMQGAETDWAKNGNEAVEMFLKSGQPPYDVILMDIRMPEKNGLEAAREIRASDHPDSRTIPVFALTANSFKEDEKAAYEAGMTGFIPKPVDLQYLCSILREYV